MKSTLVLVAFTWAAKLAGCAHPTASSIDKSFEVVLHATSDEGQPVEGVRFSRGGSPIGTTDANGTVATRIRGADGETLPVTTACPDAYLAPEQPTVLRLTEVRKLDQPAPSAILLDVVCVRKLRDIVLVVRTSRAPALPLEIAGKSVSMTDANGHAQVRMQLDREVRSLSVSLATASAPKLRPQNPSRVFELDGQDAILLFDQTFSLERPPPARPRTVAAREPPKHIPYRIDSGRSHAF
jgi:hypothetical protein